MEARERAENAASHSDRRGRSANGRGGVGSGAAAAGLLVWAGLWMSRVALWLPGCFGRHRANASHTTRKLHLRVHYPFHALAGRDVDVGRRLKGPPEVVAADDGTGNEVWIPVWMTEPRAAEFRLGEGPLIGVRSLLVVGALVAREANKLRSDSTPTEEEARDRTPPTRNTLRGRGEAETTDPAKRNAGSASGADGTYAVAAALQAARTPGGGQR